MYLHPIFILKAKLGYGEARGDQDMKRRWLAAIALVLLFMGVRAQNTDSSLFLRFYGLGDDPYKTMYLAENVTNGDSVQLEVLIDFYNKNKEEILSTSDLQQLSEFVAYKKGTAPQRGQKLAELGLALLAGAADGIAIYQEQQEQEKLLEAQKKEQDRLRFEQVNAANKQKAAEFNAMTNRKYTTTSGETSLYPAQGGHKGSSNSNITTSNGDMQRAIQMSNAAYGTQATQGALNQQVQNNYNSSRNGGYGGQVIQAVMANGRAIKIQVRGDRVVAYGTGVQPGGTQNWAPAHGGIFKTTGVGNRLEAEYSYKTSFFMGNSNVTVYFDM